MGAFVFNQFQTMYLNPYNEPVDPDGDFSDDKILNRVPIVFLILATVYLSMQGTYVKAK